MAQQRSVRVAEQLHKELADLIRKDVRDPRVGLVSITHIDLNPDLTLATVHVCQLGGVLEGGPEMVAGLQRAAGWLRRQLKRRLRIRTIPELRFEHDTGLGEAVRLTSMLAQMERDRAAREGGEE